MPAHTSEALYLDAESIRSHLAPLLRKRKVSSSTPNAVFAGGEDQSLALALVQVGYGQTGKSLDTLERGFARRDDTTFFLGLEQRFDPVRGEPRCRLSSVG